MYFPVVKSGLQSMKVTSKKAYFNYELGERMEAGIVLTGAEAKSAFLGQIDLDDAYIKIRSGQHKGMEAWVTNMKIFPYKHADNTNYDQARMRKLLLHQKEILELMNKMKQMNRIVVPVAAYTKSGRIKIELALARGKRVYEKREKIKQRDQERDVERFR